MLKKKELVRTVEYWMETIQNELFRQLTDYMEKEQKNKTELAQELKVSKGYISQILNGAFNFTLKKLIEISLAIGKVPSITFISFDEYLEKEAQKKRIEESEAVAIQDMYLKENYLEVERTLKKLEELKNYDVNIYNSVKSVYVARLKLNFKSIEFENAKVDALLQEINKPELFIIRINNKPAKTIQVLELVEEHKSELQIKDTQDWLGFKDMIESLKNVGVNISYEIDFKKIRFQN